VLAITNISLEVPHATDGTVTATNMRLTMTRTLIPLLCAFLLAACSKGTVEVNTAPSGASAQPLARLQQMPPQQRADRIVEIDRLLSAPVTGDPSDSDRRVALRAERAALTGNPNPAVFSSRPAPISTNVARVPSAGAFNYPQPPFSSNGIVVAPNSQATSLSFLEQMTPSERERYYKALRLRNTQTVDVVVRHQ
jgi:hypothetical protein